MSKNMKNFLVFFSLLFFPRIFSKNITYIQSDDYKKNNDQIPLKFYLKEDLQNFTELLYLEFLLKSEFNETQKYLSSYTIKINWFTNLTTDYFENGLFYGLGQVKINEKNNLFFDLSICKVFNIINRCDDYNLITDISNPLVYSDFYINNTLNSSYINYFIEKKIQESFNPTLDTLNINGTDDLFNYQTYSLITDNINDFKSQIRFRISLPMYVKDRFNLDLDISNYIVFFFGTFYDKDLLKVKSLAQRNDFKVFYFFKIF